VLPDVTRRYEDSYEKGEKVYIMNTIKKAALLIAMIGIALAGTAGAASTLGTDVTYNIDPNHPSYSARKHWTLAGSPYHLKQVVYVLPGATLTIDANVVVASYKPDQGTLAVCRGAQIFVNGTADQPVIMTSAQDVNCWTGSVVTYDSNYSDPCDPSERIVTDIITMGNPKSGKWRARCNDWGNLTVMGRGYISASHYGGNPVIINGRANTKCPDCLNQKQMEGLTDANNALYGGCNDDDDSGSIHYLSLRYGGKVIGLANELNGMSLGALGRNTDIDHVEIMNNVDDGIEIYQKWIRLDVLLPIYNIHLDSYFSRFLHQDQYNANQVFLLPTLLDQELFLPPKILRHLKQKIILHLYNFWEYLHKQS
jgi:hypothetical protein